MACCKADVQRATPLPYRPPGPPQNPVWHLPPRTPPKQTAPAPKVAASSVDPLPELHHRPTEIRSPSCPLPPEHLLMPRSRQKHACP